MQVTRTEDLNDYYDFLRDNTDEAQALLGDLLISVTTFFRDREAFEALQSHVIHRLFRGQGAERADSRLGAGLRHRRRSLFARDAAAGAGGET